MKDYKNYSLLNHNTFGIDAKTARFIEYSSASELQSIAKEINGKELLHIGMGSNILFTKDYSGLILHSAIKGFEIEEETEDYIKIKAGAGECFDDFVSYATERGYYGAENLSLIPGEVGASAIQNIGAYGSEVKDLISSVEAMDYSTGSLVVFSGKDCGYAYRDSYFKNKWKGKFAVTSVTYKLSKVFEPDIEYGAIRSEIEKRGIDKITSPLLRKIIIDIRNEKLPDPKIWGNGGSFFMNPVVERAKAEKLLSLYPQMPNYDAVNGVKIPAGWLIEQCGWKGKKLGKAGVYEKQALVLINCGGATGADIVDLSNAICLDIKEKFDITIKPEVNWI